MNLLKNFQNNDCLKKRNVTESGYHPYKREPLPSFRASATTLMASAAKQSMVGPGTLHGLLRYARHDGVGACSQ